MLPEAFQERMRRMLGEEYGAFLAGTEKGHCLGLRLNALKIGLDGRTAAAASCGETGFAHLEAVPWAEDGYYYLPEDQPGKHPFQEAGVYYIQEPSAMAPARLLDVTPGERVLDLCAAPGGKSTQLAAKLRGQGFLVCNEIHPARAKILSENIERLGIGNACVTNETPERLAEFFPGYFDKILVDAPCSGEGMFRKEANACAEWSLENVMRCAQRQDGILDCAAGMLRPGGKLVYSTCTFAPEENEGSISRFLCRHGEFSLLPIGKETFGKTGCDGASWHLADPIPGLEMTLRMWPHHLRGEGHFAALLQKDGDAVEISRDTKGDMAASGDVVRFFEENISGKWDVFAGLGGPTRILLFGNHIYLVPAGLPSLRGLKVLRPGLHLGEQKKNRFEPSHALALAMDPRAAAHVWNLDSRDPSAAAYLEGQALAAQGEKGWYLVCVDGFGIGWGKLSGGILKNHYPIGLRRRR